jgi:hypothetical protein
MSSIFRIYRLRDPNQLGNAILNLCIDARDAMKAGGRLTKRATVL